MQIVNVLKLSESSFRSILEQWNKGKDNNNYYFPENEEDKDIDQQISVEHPRQRLLFNVQEAKYIGSMLGIQWKTNPPRFKLTDFYDGLNEELSKNRKYKNKLSVFKDKDDVLAIGKIVLHNLSIDPNYYSEQLAVSAKKNKSRGLAEQLRGIGRNEVGSKRSKIHQTKRQKGQGPTRQKFDPNDYIGKDGKLDIDELDEME